MSPLSLQHHPPGPHAAPSSRTFDAFTLPTCHKPRVSRLTTASRAFCLNSVQATAPCPSSACHVLDGRSLPRLGLYGCPQPRPSPLPEVFSLHQPNTTFLLRTPLQDKCLWRPHYTGWCSALHGSPHLVLFQMFWGVAAPTPPPCSISWELLSLGRSWLFPADPPSKCVPLACWNPGPGKAVPTSSTGTPGHGD